MANPPLSREAFDHEHPSAESAQAEGSRMSCARVRVLASAHPGPLRAPPDASRCWVPGPITRAPAVPAKTSPRTPRRTHARLWPHCRLRMRRRPESPPTDHARAGASNRQNLSRRVLRVRALRVLSNVSAEPRRVPANSERRRLQRMLGRSSGSANPVSGTTFEIHDRENPHLCWPDPVEQPIWKPS